MLCDFQLGKFCVLPINHPGKHVMEDDDTPDFRTALAEIAGALNEMMEEVHWWHRDYLKGGVDYEHPRGSGWARVYEKAQAALTAHAAAIKGAKP